MEKEDMRKQEEHKMKEDDHKQRKRNNQFEEWEKLQSNIRLLRKDLKENADDDDIKAEIQEDITGLVKRKNQLAETLGLK